MVEAPPWLAPAKGDSRIFHSCPWCDRYLRVVDYVDWGSQIFTVMSIKKSLDTKAGMMGILRIFPQLRFNFGFRKNKFTVFLPCGLHPELWDRLAGPISEQWERNKRSEADPAHWERNKVDALTGWVLRKVLGPRNRDLPHQRPPPRTFSPELW